MPSAESKPSQACGDSVSLILRFPDGRTDVYDGSRFVGSVTTCSGRFVVKDRWGERIGAFDEKNTAVAVVVAAKKQ